MMKDNTDLSEKIFSLEKKAKRSEVGEKLR